MPVLLDLVVGVINWFGKTKGARTTSTPLNLLSKTRAPLVLIETGHEGWKQGWRGNPVALQPGFHWKFMPHEVVCRIDKREASMHLPRVQAYTSDSIPVECTGFLRFQVENGEKALFGLQDIQKWTRDLALGAITSIISSRHYTELSGAPNKVHTIDVAELNTYASEKGVRCLELRMHQIQPVRSEAAKAIKQRIMAESEAKLMAVDIKQVPQ